MDANLSRAVLKGVNFRKATLVWTNLSESDLSDCNLEKADFTGPMLDSANLDRANLERTLFRNASLKHANLANTETMSCILAGAETAGTVLQYVSKRAGPQRHAPGLSRDTGGESDISGVEGHVEDDFGSALEEARMEDIDLADALEIGEEFATSDAR